MIFSIFARCTAAVLFLCLVFSIPVRAQTPSASTIALAKELVILKGSTTMLDTIVPGVIETAKNMFLQTNPMYGKDLNDIAAQMRKDFEPKRDELITEVAKIYAERFTEQDIKDILAFYKTPVGKKMLVEEPASVDLSMTRTQVWANRFSEEVLNKMRAEMKKKGHDL
jgi:hypothetical protein